MYSVHEVGEGHSACQHGRVTKADGTVDPPTYIDNGHVAAVIGAPSSGHGYAGEGQVGNAASGLSVKISKRTGKLVRKYEQKIKKEPLATKDSGGTGSLVGEVVAMIDRITGDLQEGNLQGVIGNHVPCNSDLVHINAYPPAQGNVHKGKQFSETGGLQIGSAGSGNKGSRRGRALLRPRAKEGSGTPECNSRSVRESPCAQRSHKRR